MKVDMEKKHMVDEPITSYREYLSFYDWLISRVLMCKYLQHGAKSRLYEKWSIKRQEFRNSKTEEEFTELEKNFGVI